MIKSIFLFYLFVSMISLITEALVVTRALWNGFPMMKKQTICTICTSFLPIMHVINIMSNLILIFERKDNFIFDILKIRVNTGDMTIREVEKLMEEKNN